MWVLCACGPHVRRGTNIQPEEDVEVLPNARSCYAALYDAGSNQESLERESLDACLIYGLC